MTARRWRRGDGDSHGRHPTRRGHNEVESMACRRRTPSRASECASHAASTFLTKSGEHAHATSPPVTSALTASISSMSILSTSPVEASAAIRVLLWTVSPSCENGNGKVNYTEFASWAQDRLADVAVDDINYTTRSNVNVGQIQAIAASKIGA